MLGFGILTGAGIGFAYAATTPPAVKWFPAARTGLIAGLVVSGFGLASVYTASLSKWLIAQFGIQIAMLVLGIGFFILITGIKSIASLIWNGLAGILESPPEGYVLEKQETSRKAIVHDKNNGLLSRCLRARSFILSGLCTPLEQEPGL
ncbi:MAG: hypothetical protein U9O59_02025 [Actinomycetota bacterium]|nr:hypothetical protein [Actinomycetota bacterium]